MFVFCNKKNSKSNIVEFLTKSVGFCFGVIPAKQEIVLSIFFRLSGNVFGLHNLG